jgi:eukaryotic-like serine/threonine-protein kinase
MQIEYTATDVHPGSNDATSLIARHHRVEERCVTAVPNLIGTRLGAYEIQALIGSGGMAGVYRAFDHNLQRSVAIKVLSASAAAEPHFAERFRQEARLIANLRHPNIVHIYDFGEQGGLTYMVQELLPGPTLEQRLSDLAAQSARMSRDEIIANTAQLASALDAAHAVGIIHRDVKPSNALWNAADMLVLTDFGIAKNTLSGINQTQVGMVLGTPNYLSPEQAQGHPLTAASDIYALGVVIYELISGALPFEGTTPMGIIVDHIRTPPPPLRPHRADLPSSAEAVVLRALAKSPTDRYTSAGELAQALENGWPPAPGAGPIDVHNQVTQRWASAPRPPAQSQPRLGAPPAAIPVATQRSRLMLPILGGLLALLLLGGVILASRGHRAANDRTGGGATAAPVVGATATSSGQLVATVKPSTAPSAASRSPAVPTVPAVATGPFPELRTLLAAGNNDGRVRDGGQDLLAKLDAAERALSSGDTQTTTTTLYALQKQLLDGARTGAIAPDFAREALANIDALARSYQLKLPFSVSSR